jgi:hypothetical protein
VEVTIKDSHSSLPVSCVKTKNNSIGDGELFGGGNNSYGVLGLGHKNEVNGVHRIPGFEHMKVLQVAATNSAKHALILTDHGLYGIGDNS